MNSAGLWAGRQGARQDAERAGSASCLPACSMGKPLRNAQVPAHLPSASLWLGPLCWGIIICCWGKPAANHSSSERRMTDGRGDECFGLVSVKRTQCRRAEVRLESNG